MKRDYLVINYPRFVAGLKLNLTGLSLWNLLSKMISLTAKWTSLLETTSLW